MIPRVVLVSIPGLRRQDLAMMPKLSTIAKRGSAATLIPSFPCVTCPVQANLTTGVHPDQHGVIANGFYYRDKGEVEMWTAWNDCILAPQIWDHLHHLNPDIRSAVWFALHSKGAGADYVCTPAPIHNPDGSESLWCYTKPENMYEDLRDALGHFPLMNFWGPLANIKSTNWIVDSLCEATHKLQQHFTYVYLPHLDYQAQKFGPNSPQAMASLQELDNAIGRLVMGIQSAELGPTHWLFASEYAINEVNAVSYPNRALYMTNFLGIHEEYGQEYLVPGASHAWALVDHQLAHVFVRDPADIDKVVKIFQRDPLVEEILVGDERAKYGLNHERSGEVILVSRPDAWFAYYWWLDDARAPAFAHTVDIHRKPGYDPVELFIRMPERTIPLDATLVKGSHGYPATDESRYGVLVSSRPLEHETYYDVDVAGIILLNFAQAMEQAEHQAKEQAAGQEVAQSETEVQEPAKKSAEEQESAKQEVSQDQPEKQDSPGPGPSSPEAGSGKSSKKKKKGSQPESAAQEPAQQETAKPVSADGQPAQPGASPQESKVNPAGDPSATQDSAGQEPSVENAPGETAKTDAPAAEEKSEPVPATPEQGEQKSLE